MRPVRVRRKSGSTFGFWHSARSGNIDSRSQRTGESYHTSYAHQEVWVCKGCKKPRSDWTPAHYAFILLLGLLAWLFLVPGTGTRTDGDPDIGNSEMRDPDDSSPDDQGPAPDIEMPDTNDSPTPPDPRLELPPEEFNFDVPEILDAERKAVSAGKAIRWRSGGDRGYAVPSEVTVAPETGVQCRNVYATVDGSDQQSRTIRMCQSPTGAWVQG